jgi:hypothetical protein
MLSRRLKPQNDPPKSPHARDNYLDTPPVPLNMTRPPEMAKLAALVETLQSKLGERLNSTIRPQQTSDGLPGVLDVIVPLTFGVGMSQAVLGRKDV